MAAELEKAARERIATVAGELESAARLKLDAAAGAWYWLVRLFAKCWGSAPKYRLVRDDEEASQASAAGSD